MQLVPFALPFTFLANAFTIALLAGGVYLVSAWFAGIVVATAYLVGGVAALAWTLFGRFVVLLFWRRGSDEPSADRGAPWCACRARHPGSTSSCTDRRMPSR
jgi:hypothetical protein